MATHYLAIDIGSTTLAAVIVDLDTGTIVGSSSVANTAEITSTADKKIGRSEWDLEEMTDLAVTNAAALIARISAQPAAVGVTGQQQGLQLVDDDLKTVDRFISWQDQRSKEIVPGQQRTYLEMMGDVGGAVVEAGGLPAFENTGCPLVTGYTAPNLLWLQANDRLPTGVHATTAPEFVVSRLTGERPVTDPTDALSWGVYDVVKLDWDFDLIETLGLDRSLLSTLAESCTRAGQITKLMASKLGVHSGIPVSVASGDHQCSFAGTVADYTTTLAINVGTGGQASVYVEKPMPRGWLELRPFLQSGYLLAGVGVVGGRTFRTLRDFFSRTISALAEQDLDPHHVYQRLVELAVEVPAGAGFVRSNGCQAGRLVSGSAEARRQQEIATGRFGKRRQVESGTQSVTRAGVRHADTTRSSHRRSCRGRCTVRRGSGRSLPVDRRGERLFRRTSTRGEQE